MDAGAVDASFVLAAEGPDDWRRRLNALTADTRGHDFAAGPREWDACMRSRDAETRNKAEGGMLKEDGEKKKSKEKKEGEPNWMGLIRKGQRPREGLP